MSFPDNLKDSNCSSQPEKMEMDEILSNEESVENQLLRDSGSEDQSCSSSILDTPKRTDSIDIESDDDVNVTIKSALVDEKGSNPSENKGGLKIKWRKNLTSGQKSKMKKLLKSGLSMEEARMRVFSKDVPETPNAVKRSRDGEQCSSGEKPDAKRTKSHLCPKERAGLSNFGNQATSTMEIDQSDKEAKGTREGQGRSKSSKAVSNSGGRSYRDVASLVKVGIISKGFPSKIMSTAHLDAVQDALLLKIEEQRHAVIKPKFTNCSYKSGYLVLACKDQATATWLKDVTRSLTPWENAELIALDEKDIPRPDLFHAFLPLSADYSNERLKGLIESQNDGISTNGWRILNRSNANKHAEWTLNVDEESLKILANCNFVLNFRFGETQLRKVKTQGQRQCEGKPNDDNTKQNDKDERPPSDSTAGTSGAKLEATSKGSKKIFEKEGKNDDRLSTTNNDKNSPREIQDGSKAPPTGNQEPKSRKDETN